MEHGVYLYCRMQSISCVFIFGAADGYCAVRSGRCLRVFSACAPVYDRVRDPCFVFVFGVWHRSHVVRQSLHHNRLIWYFSYYIEMSSTVSRLETKRMDKTLPVSGSKYVTSMFAGSMSRDRLSGAAVWPCSISVFQDRTSYQKDNWSTGLL